MDSLTPEQRSVRMAAIRSKDSKPELAVRKLVYALGYRYRLHNTKLPGKPDLVFPKLRKVIFVHGCFWHRHSDPSCHLARLPKSKLDFWLPKLQSNFDRDIVKQQELSKIGWGFLVIWECQIARLQDLELKIKTFLNS
jgi:DNA mismatch endonuclease, patch repair protein